MINLGHKSEVETASPIQSKDKNPQIYYPSFHVSNVDLGLGEDDVGKVLTAVVKVKINSAGKSIRTDGKKTKTTHNYSIDVLGIEFKGIKGSKPNADWSTEEILEYSKKNNE